MPTRNVAWRNRRRTICSPRTFHIVRLATELLWHQYHFMLMASFHHEAGFADRRRIIRTIFKAAELSVAAVLTQSFRLRRWR